MLIQSNHSWGFSKSPDIPKMDGNWKIPWKWNYGSTIPQWLTIQWMGLESVQMRAVGEIYWVYIVGILHDLSTPDHQ